ncbi:pyridoxamine 5'-phosphate oxidase family protein [Streptomyces sp. NPDC094032]|uniref:pyridoxamine 5'-phosphate oxidase family protein n=1 Tax=Streptomyces sp. NPDC094032 TaxID=3155308 RepID=UPI00331D93F2
MSATVTLRVGPYGLRGAEDAPFAPEAFLARPLVARLATQPLVIQPVWYLWEDSEFWVITGSWSTLTRRLRADPAFSLVVDECDLETGRTRQVIARGTGAVVTGGPDRARRKLTRYLGPDETAWDPRFRPGPDLRWARLTPTTLRVADLSFQVPAPASPPSPGRPYDLEGGPHVLAHSTAPDLGGA